MKKWEYRREDSLSVEGLNRLGEQGWEMCAARSNGAATCMWFKREVVERVDLPIEPDPGA